LLALNFVHYSLEVDHVLVDDTQLSNCNFETFLVQLEGWQLFVIKLLIKLLNVVSRLILVKLAITSTRLTNLIEVLDSHKDAAEFGRTVV